MSVEVWSQRHRGLTWLLWVHVPTLLAFALYRGETAASAAAQVGILAVAAAIAMVPFLSRNVRSSSTSIGLVVGASILVHIAGGSTTAHFQFFVILAFLTLYQAWTPYLLALGYVVLEHGVLGALDPHAVFNDQAAINHPWKYAAIHGIFVLAASFGNVLAWRLTEQEALHDSLTSLPNRAFFLDALTKSLDGRDRTSTAVLFLDLDNFKDANDGFGHDVGDALLQALSLRLRGWLRTGDVLARLGGDEFAIMLCDIGHSDEARRAAERVLAAFSEPVAIADITLACSASIGLAFADSDTESATDLLRNADLAMYEAKRDGGGRVAEYRPILHTVALRRTELENELREAFDNDEFVLHYQPIFELSQDRLVGTEALIRWQHPTRGLVPPLDFIPAAEQSGLIVSLGAWVLRTACQQTAAWHARHPDRAPLTISVNLSPRQLVDRTLVATVAEALHDSGLDASSLCLEVTEGSVIKDFDATLSTLHALRKLGVSLALDDFGTGYSSLSYLTQLPVTCVKIDRSFVADLDKDTPSTQIIVAIIDLAHALGMSVTAEGAETTEQLDALRAMHSDHGQGYLLGRPQPSHDIAPIIDADPRRGAHDPAEMRVVADVITTREDSC
ncbi:MAG TPA: EAL domain-containing protein [Mycobacteriales bacterium]|nr:EAL domain-containing protein [Mycobacteriales bacterium]